MNSVATFYNVGTPGKPVAVIDSPNCLFVQIYLDKYSDISNMDSISSNFEVTSVEPSVVRGNAFEFGIYVIYPSCSGNLEASFVCESCTLNCQCSTANTCDSCKAGYTPSTSGGVKSCECESPLSIVEGKCMCPVSQFLNADDSCSGCIEGCDVCEDSISRAKCSSNEKYSYDGVIAACTCPAGFKVVEEVCTMTCVQNCVLCADSGSCILCDDSYVVSENLCVKGQRYFQGSYISSHKFDVNWAYLDITFNKHLINLGTDCSNYLTSVTVLGANPSCFFITSTVLRIILGSVYGFMDSIVFSGSLLTSDGAYYASPSDYTLTTIQTPDPLNLVAVINGPDHISTSCESPLGIYDGSLSYGNAQKALTYTWSADSGVILSSYSDPITTVTSYPSSSGSFTLTLTVDSSWGLQSEANLLVTVNSSPAAVLMVDPAVATPPPDQQFFIAQAYIVSSCGSIAGLTYNWDFSVFSGVTTPVIASNKAIISLLDLTIGHTYTFSVQGGDSNSRSISVTRQPPAIVAVISYQGDAPLNTNLFLDGSSSYTSDYSSLIYSWVSTAGSPSSGSGSGITIGLLGLPPGLTFTVTLTVTNTYSVSASTTGTYTTIAGAYTSTTAFLKVNKVPASADLTITSLTTMFSTSWSNYWSMAFGELALNNPQYNYLAIPAGSLVPGHHYSFMLTVTASFVSTRNYVNVAVNMGAACPHAL